MAGPEKNTTHIEPIDAILDERQRTHGDFADVAYISQHLKAAATRVLSRKAMDSDTAGWPAMAHPLQESFDMIASKLGRICAGDPNEVDHWRDIAGYAQLAVRHLEKTKT